MQVVPEDYSDEGQGNEIVDGNEDIVSYSLPVEIFVSSLEVEFTDIGCVGLGGALNYAITLQDSEGEQIAEGSGSVACGETSSWNEMISADDEISLGDYQVSIELTNGGTPVQSNWNYRFEIIYNF